MNKLVIKADLFPFKFQKCFLRTLNFLLGIFIWFLSPIQIIWNVCSLPKFSPFSPFSQLYTEINNQFKENLPAIPHVNPSSKIMLKTLSCWRAGLLRRERRPPVIFCSLTVRPEFLSQEKAPGSMLLSPVDLPVGIRWVEPVPLVQRGCGATLSN